MDIPSSLRERTRRAVRAELVDTAQDLFVRQGYEATTVDQIAEAAGLSKRSFFRYFASKEALVIGKYDGVIETFLTTLTARPAEEPLWTSLRRVFDYVVGYSADAQLARRMRVLDGVVEASEALRGAFLERLARGEQELTALARERAAAAGRPYAVDDPTLRAVVGSAFACLHAAREVSARTGQPLGRVLDRTMEAVGPLA